MAGVTRIWPPKGMVNGPGKVASLPDTEVEVVMTGAPPGPVTVTVALAGRPGIVILTPAGVGVGVGVGVAGGAPPGWNCKLAPGPKPTAEQRASDTTPKTVEVKGAVGLSKKFRRLPEAPAKLSWRPHTAKPGMGVGVMVLLKKALRMVPSPPRAPAAVGVRSTPGRA
jgi:hypothetical protein